MTDFIEKLSKSVPTCSEEESDLIQQSLLTSSHGKDWILFSSVVLGMESVSSLADLYTYYFSEVITSDEVRLPSSAPISIFGADKINYKYIGMLYSNGAVLYAESESPDEEPLLLLYLEKEFVDSMKMIYLDSETKTIVNLPQEVNEKNQALGHESGMQD